MDKLSKSVANSCEMNLDQRFITEKSSFEITYSKWIEQTNQEVQKIGLWCDDLRVW